MYPQPAQQGFPSPDPGLVYALALTALRGVSYTGEVILRRPGSIGRRAHNAFVPLAALILMSVWAYIWANEFIHTGDPAYQLGPFIFFVIFWALVSWCHVIGRGLRNRFGGYPPLSYDGTPWLRFRNWSEVKIKDRLEPMVVFVIGGLIGLLGNAPLGLWLFITGVCMAGSTTHDKWRRKEKVRETDDMLARQMEQIEDMKQWGNRGRW